AADPHRPDARSVLHRRRQRALGLRPGHLHRRWLVHVFYVARDNHDGRIPVLRRKVLGAGPTLHDGQSDLVRGIEDLQIQLGIDTIGDGTVDSYVDPALESFAQLLSATSWVKAPADGPAADHADSKNS